MKKAALPPNEAERLEALRRYEILDSEAEQSFDDIALLVSQICETPMSQISFVDQDRQWFKAKVGIEDQETSRDVAFCAHTILGPDLFVIPDAMKDERFHDNPLVTNPGVRFYAGAPLVTDDGHAIGSLCAVDRVPRELRADQKESLQALSRLVVQQLELRRAIKERTEAERASSRDRDQLNRFFTLSLDLLCLVGTDGYFKRLNPSWSRVLGYTEEELLAHPYMDLIHPDDQRATIDEAGRLAEGYTTLRFENRYRCKDGSYRWFLWNATPSPTPGLLYATARDITDRKATEDTLREAHRRLGDSLREMERQSEEMTTLNEMGELLQSCETADEACQVVSEYVTRLFPDCGGALYFMSPSRSDLEAAVQWNAVRTHHDVFPPNHCWALRRSRIHKVTTRTALTCRHIGTAGSSTYVCVPLVAHGEATGVLHIQGLQSGEGASAATETAISETLAVAVADQIALALANLRLRESLHHQSIRDPLTGLFNRRYMEESLEREVHRSNRNRKPLAVLMIDVDKFKEFNDTFGHDAGDVMLREVGSFLKSQVRKEDIACRYGGEEFTLILPDASLEGAARRAETIRSAVKELAIHHSNRLLRTITLSIGLAAFPDHSSSRDGLIRIADAALYRAKSGGRDRVVVASSGSTERQPDAGDADARSVESVVEELAAEDVRPASAQLRDRDSRPDPTTA